MRQRSRSQSGLPIERGRSATTVERSTGSFSMYHAKASLCSMRCPGVVMTLTPVH